MQALALGGEDFVHRQPGDQVGHAATHRLADEAIRRVIDVEEKVSRVAHLVLNDHFHVNDVRVAGERMELVHRLVMDVIFPGRFSDADALAAHAGDVNNVHPIDRPWQPVVEAFLDVGLNDNAEAPHDGRLARVDHVHAGKCIDHDRQHHQANQQAPEWEATQRSSQVAQPGRRPGQEVVKLVGARGLRRFGWNRSRFFAHDGLPYGVVTSVVVVAGVLLTGAGPAIVPGFRNCSSSESAGRISVVPSSINVL